MHDVYYLVKYASLNQKGDFETLVGEIKTYAGMSIEMLDDTHARVVIDGENKEFFVSLFGEKNTLFEGEDVSVLELRCEQNNPGHMNLLRMVGKKFGFRMYSVRLGAFLPRDTHLMPVLTQSHFPENVLKTFRLFSLEPVFVNFGEDLIYAKDIQGVVHIVNFGILDYYTHFGIETPDTDEFSYAVAQSIPLFVSLYDHGLVPVSFYEFYKKSMKVFNFSEIDMWHVGRKIFIKPLVFYWNARKQDFEPLTADRAALNIADKIRPGENFQTAMERVLREELKIEDAYLCMRVNKTVEFDRDKENKLTPRVVGSAFFLKLGKVDSGVLEQLGRSWSSTDRTVN